MIHSSMREHEGEESRPDIIGRYGERLILPPVVLPDFVAYTGETHHPLHVFSLEVAHERGTFRGQARIFVDFGPISNPLHYRDLGGVGGGGGGVNYNKRPVYTPLGDINIQYLVTELGRNESKERDEFQYLKPPIAIEITIDGFKEGGGIITRAFSDLRRVCVVYAGGRVFTGSEEKFDSMQVQSGKIWYERFGNGSLNPDGLGLLYLPYDSGALSKVELSVTDPAQVIKSR